MLAQKPTLYLWRAQARQRGGGGGGKRAVTSQSTLGDRGGGREVTGREEPRTKRGERVTPRTRIIFTYISSASST